MVNDIWVGVGILAWLVFIFMTKPRDFMEWVMVILLIVPCCVAGPLMAPVIVICNKIDPIRRS